MTKVCVRVCVWGGGHIFCFVEYFDKSQFFVTPLLSLSICSSVTKFGDLWKFSMTKFLTNVAQIASLHLGYIFK